MIKIEDIRNVDLEISTRCNAACPDCPRNFRGVNCIDTYPLTELSLADIKKILSPTFLQQLKGVRFNGNLGDFITARDCLPIVEYIRSANKDMYIEINTNASAKPNVWEPLAKLGVTVFFRIDGLADTHHLYRRNTNFDLILSNAKKYITAGGEAHWVMILFDHNKHQVKKAKQMSEELGFAKFSLIDVGRNTFPVFNNDKTFAYNIGSYTGSTNFDELYSLYLQGHEWISKTKDVIDCYSLKNKEIYIAANGEVYPCCFMGFYPKHKFIHGGNHSLRPLVKNNNALEVGLETAIDWFNQIPNTWDKSIDKGRLVICNESCGKCIDKNK